MACTTMETVLRRPAMTTAAIAGASCVSIRGIARRHSESLRAAFSIFTPSMSTRSRVSYTKSNKTVTQQPGQWPNALVKLDTPACMFRGRPPVLFRPVLHCKYWHEVLTDIGAAISLLPAPNVPIWVTVQHSEVVIEGISSKTHSTVGKVKLKIQPQLSEKVFNVTLYTARKAVFHLFGANFTRRFAFVNIIVFETQRLRAEDPHVIARATSVNDRKAVKLSSSIMGFQHFLRRWMIYWIKRSWTSSGGSFRTFRTQEKL